MIKYLIMDVDGTLTDGKIYMGENGEIMKAFSVKDGYVFNYILKPQSIIPIVITARNSKIVQKRCDELGIKDVYQGKLDKLSVLNEIVEEQNLASCAYFGDDLLDLQCMMPIKEAGGIVGCPADAVEKVKVIADYICVNKAGDGALREFVEWIVGARQPMNDIDKKIEKYTDYMKNLKVTEKDIGKHVVDSDFFYVVQKYLTKNSEECELESHRKYIDVQIMLKGTEVIQIADTSKLSIKKEYDDKKDVVYWHTKNAMNQVLLREGDYIILYPEMAHKGAIKLDESEEVLKIVGKVLLVDNH